MTNNHRVILKVFQNQIEFADPEIRDAFHALDDSDQMVIFRQCETMSNQVRNMGTLSAIETIYKLGSFLRKADPAGMYTAELEARAGVGRAGKE